MDNKIKITIIGNNETIVSKQKKILSVLPNASIDSIANNLEHDALQHVLSDNDIVIFNLSEAGQQELHILEELGIMHSAVIAIGEQGDFNILKKAISAGVSEFISYEDYESRLIHVVDKIKFQAKNKLQSGRHKTIVNAVINAKGGGGASFIASNLAYILSEKTDDNVLLVDMDFQFGAIGLNFDIDPKYTIIDALTEINEVDATSVFGYVAKYNKLGLMLPSADDVILPGEIPAASLNKLFGIVNKNYQHIVVDLPRIIDPLSSLVMEKADRVTIVVQQSLVQFRDGRRLVQILNKDLDIPLEKICVVINRYDKNNSLRRSDITQFLKHEKVFTVANDFSRVASASNLGVPLYESSANSKIGQDLLKLALFIGNVKLQKKKGLLDRVFGIFS